MSQHDIMADVITEVQQYPILWRMGLEVYKRTDQKENAWKSISDKLGLSVKDVRDIWAKARTKFSKLKNEHDMATRSGAATVPEPDWPFYKSLKFLIGNCRKVKKQATITTFRVEDILTATTAVKCNGEAGSSVSDEASGPSKLSFMDSSPIFVDDDLAEALEASLPESSATGICEMDVKKNQECIQLFPQVRSKPSEESVFLSGVKKIIEGIPRPTSVNTNNPDLAFGTFVATTLMGMDDEEKKEKKKLITSILFE